MLRNGDQDGDIKAQEVTKIGYWKSLLTLVCTTSMYEYVVSCNRNFCSAYGVVILHIMCINIMQHCELLPVDIYEDQFAKKAKEKRERVAKNELQRLRNIARRSKSKGNM